METQASTRICGVLAVSCLLSFTVQALAGRRQASKPIVIATTDDEIDDRCSMIRFLIMPTNGISDGDSPAFMHLIDVGLGSTVHPTYGGWGGRFIRTDNRWRSAPDDRDRYKTILRWASAFQNDWAARADWCVKPRARCNHRPVVVCNQNRSEEGLAVVREPVYRSCDPLRTFSRWQLIRA